MILIGMGANLDGVDGTPEECLRATVLRLEARGITVEKMSGIWKTAPVPISDQPWYRNAVCSVESELEPHALLAVLASIEDDVGRVRRGRNEARVIDLDLLAYNDRLIEGKDLHIPHPRMSDRAFVLYPLQEVVPDWVHPISGVSVSELIKNLPKDQEIERIQEDTEARHG